MENNTKNSPVTIEKIKKSEKITLPNVVTLGFITEKTTAKEQAALLELKYSSSFLLVEVKGKRKISHFDLLDVKVNYPIQVLISEPVYNEYMRFKEDDLPF